MNYSAIVLCAGSGKRTGLEYNKMFFQLKDQTVYQTTINHFIKDEQCTQIIVVCKKEEEQQFKTLCTNSKITYCKGGKERQDSVYQGLQQVTNPYVLVHDGARPYINQQLLNEVCSSVEKHDACVVMVPSVDTIKEVCDGKVVRTIPRDTLMNAQTPQAFKTQLLKDCYKVAHENNIVVSDDSSLVELCSTTPVYVVVGSYENKKITTSEDVK